MNAGLGESQVVVRRNKVKLRAKHHLYLAAQNLLRRGDYVGPRRSSDAGGVLPLPDVAAAIFWEAGGCGLWLFLRNHSSLDTISAIAL
jgi:hypothetical protein